MKKLRFYNEYAPIRMALTIYLFLGETEYLIPLFFPIFKRIYVFPKNCKKQIPKSLYFFFEE